MKIVIVTSCTASKRITAENPLTDIDFAVPDLLAAREVQFALAGSTLPAEEMYTGRQHDELRRGVALFRSAVGGEAVDLRILSAGYGLIRSDRRVAPYECTFDAMPLEAALIWARRLKARADFDRCVRGADLCFILLGSRYLRVLELTENYFGPRLIALASEKDAGLLPKGTVIIPAGKEEARAHKSGLVALKGYLFRRLAEHTLERGAIGTLSSLIERPEGAVDLIGKPAPSRARKFISLPGARAVVKRVRERARTVLPDRPLFYLPEWDDRVDPNYDFPSDAHTSGRDPYRDDRYAHEMYGAPVADGILVSRPVLEGNAQKIDEAQRVGIHAYLRLPQGVAVFGDCGAFEYVGDHTPPYEPEEMVEYYDALGFDLGVSVDHAIFHGVVMRVEHWEWTGESWRHIAPETFRELVKDGVPRASSRGDTDLFGSKLVYEVESVDWKEIERRYELTISNAARFMKEYLRAPRCFEPVGVIQGWESSEDDSEGARPAGDFSYATAAARLLEMGYTYLAVGGLVRSRDKEVIQTIRAIRERIGYDTKLHIFGVARESLLPEFRRYQVTSADSAGPLRQAWLSSTKNYITADGQSYVAIRVPYSTEARREAPPGADRVEALALSALRAYDRSEIGLESALAAVTRYSELIEGEEVAAELVRKYRRTLEERPWRDCPCTICKSLGVEVLVFRGNNRNRRRGFHNVRTFFERFQAHFSSAKTPLVHRDLVRTAS